MDKDTQMVKALNQIMNEATFNLKGKEIIPYVMILKWLDELPKRLNPEPVKPTVKKKKGKK